MVTISSRAAASVSGEGDCAPAEPAASRQMVRQTARIHERSILECLHMTAFLAAQGCGSIHDLPRAGRSGH
jgi:hypothetical protein